MAHINLLPWREELRKQRQKEFALLGFGAAVFGALLVILAHLQLAAMIDAQHQRNEFLNQQIAVLNKKMAKIKELESTKAKLLARMNIIQQLQSSRPQSVHLMDELVRTLPDGVYLTSIAQKGSGLTLKGVAQSNARVSAYMRNIDASPWLGDPKLDVITTKDVDRHRVAEFTLQAKQESADKKTAKAGAAGGKS